MMMMMFPREKKAYWVILFDETVNESTGDRTLLLIDE